MDSPPSFENKFGSNVCELKNSLYGISNLQGLGSKN